jgi:hypothetical protein
VGVGQPDHRGSRCPRADAAAGDDGAPWRSCPRGSVHVLGTGAGEPLRRNSGRWCPPWLRHAARRPRSAGPGDVDAGPAPGLGPRSTRAPQEAVEPTPRRVRRDATAPAQRPVPGASTGPRRGRSRSPGSSTQRRPPTGRSGSAARRRQHGAEHVGRAVAQRRRPGPRRAGELYLERPEVEESAEPPSGPAGARPETRLSRERGLTGQSPGQAPLGTQMS